MCSFIMSGISPSRPFNGLLVLENIHTLQQNAYGARERQVYDDVLKGCVDSPLPACGLMMEKASHAWAVVFCELLSPVFAGPEMLNGVIQQPSLATAVNSPL